jgi:2-keto-4-pentenoate hydratase/2-oxohepta-3-ene-1,7-dioic acid hydratase in catechol pathway
MRFARVIAGGAIRPAVVDAAGALRDLSAVTADIAGETLSPAALARLARLDPADLPPLEGALAPPVGGIGKIIGVGLNYRAHAAECDLPIPKEPTLFLKPTSALAGPSGPVFMPLDATALDWEVELGVVIGRGGAYIGTAHAAEHIAGYCLGIDFSEREFQFHRGGQGFKGKSSDSFAPLGPFFVTADAVGDPQALRLTLQVNGVIRQDGMTSDMIFPVVELVSFISRFMSLQPGDVILTGTPAGVGMGCKPPSYLAVGDSVVAACPVLGEQSHQVAATPTGR